MMRLRRRGAVALALVLLAGGHVPGPVLAQDERPDLKIEVVGLSPNDPREVRIVVTNVGQWWADKTTATVEAIPAAAGSKVTEAVPDLDPKQQPQGPTPAAYEFTYTLAAPCSGQKVEVKVSLSTAATFNGNTEATENLPNNAHTREVCPGAAQAGSQPVDPSDLGIKTRLPGIENVDLVLPEHLRPGTHGADGQFPPLTFTPSAVNTAHLPRRDGINPPDIHLPGGLLVGWWQYDDDPRGSAAYVAQTAVNFDLSQLDQVPNPAILKALLTFDESAVWWRHGDRTPRLVNSCVSVLGIATVDWAAQPSVNALFPNSGLWESPPGGSKEWDVAAHVRDQMRERGNRALRYGYVLRGGLEDVRGDDDDSCLSAIGNLRLTITYVVPTGGR